ncbi:MAG: extracellular solute-binding protein, partial [Spirochaetia bacterium]
MKRTIFFVGICIFLCTSLLSFTLAQQEEKAEEVKLVLWDAQTLTKLGDKVDSAVQEFMKENPNVAIEVAHFEVDAYKTKLKIAMGGGTPPDIFQNWAGGVLKEYVDSGMVY